ncbi:DUF1385 domain-containing protein [bacterium]
MSEIKKNLVGGQAVIEGVMMKSPNFYSVVVRKSDGTLVTKTESCPSITKKYPILKKRFLRGMIVLWETMVLGMKILSYSADIYASDIEQKEGQPKQESPAKTSNKTMGIAIAGTIIFSFGLGICLFVLLPLWITQFVKGMWTAVEHHIMFNFVDGLVRLAIFLLYVISISLLKDIRRVFEYHGAEHKSVFAYEDGVELTIDNVKKYSTLHPRCGTNFMFIVIILGILFVSMFKVDTFVQKVALRLIILPFLAGVSYEVIKFLSSKQDKAWARFFMMPGLMLQKITTNEPDDQQLEVAITALNEVIKSEENIKND